MELKNKTIVDAQFVLKAASESLDKAVHAAQRACGHEQIAEAGGTPPMRICLSCGMSEVGWGPGYQVLKHEGELTPPGINIHLLHQLRAGLTVTDQMKGPLLRREKSVVDLVDEHFGVESAAPMRRARP